ncbi:MAG TPA: GAF and ANTAR domain-containing protein [Mycobacteriales bacterium]|nr:GAF and ANTAR domain-containing protein [Mycobacteriales bacterium]
MAAPSVPGNLADLIRRLGDEHDEETLLKHVIEVVVSEVPGADYAGITVVDETAMFTYAPSDELVRQIDKAQYATRQGPCLDAARPDKSVVVVVDDMQSEPRWPEFTRHALTYGIRSMKCFHLFTELQAIGALNLYSREAGAFRASADQVGELLAAHAAATMAASRVRANLLVALDSRDVIGQAKGILMERHRIGADQAFQLLIAMSQRTQRKLRDVAEELTETGTVVLGEGSQA